MAAHHCLLSRRARAGLLRARCPCRPAAHQNRAAFGDANSPELRSAIRAHAHFAEYVPIIALMVAMLEMAGASPLRVHLLMAGLLLSRLMHPLGMRAKPLTWQFRIFRTGGMWLTQIVLVSAAVALLLRALREA